jgi:hypothetical protein
MDVYISSLALRFTVFRCSIYKWKLALYLVGDSRLNNDVNRVLVVDVSRSADVTEMANLANLTADSVTLGSLRFFTIRIFLGSVGQANLNTLPAGDISS